MFSLSEIPFLLPQATERKGSIKVEYLQKIEREMQERWLHENNAAASRGKVRMINCWSPSVPIHERKTPSEAYVFTVERVICHSVPAAEGKAVSISLWISLPMLSINAGIVTLVPSDSPDNYAVVFDLQKKAAFREKYSIAARWRKKFKT